MAMLTEYYCCTKDTVAVNRQCLGPVNIHCTLFAVLRGGVRVAGVAPFVKGQLSQLGIHFDTPSVSLIALSLTQA